MQNIITAASFGVHLLQTFTPSDIPFKKVVQTAYDYSGAAMLALTALATTSSYLTASASETERHTRLTYVHSFILVMIPATMFISLETWRTILLSANSLKDYLYLPIHNYQFTARAAASVGMGAFLAWQEGSTLKAAVVDTVFNFALGGLPVYRLLTKLPSNFVSRAIANLGAMKKGEILADMALTLSKEPAIVAVSEKENQCAEIKAFKFLECDQEPISRIIQTIMAYFRTPETMGNIKRICAELKTANPCEGYTPRGSKW